MVVVAQHLHSPGLHAQLEGGQRIGLSESKADTHEEPQPQLLEPQSPLSTGFWMICVQHHENGTGGNTGEGGGGVTHRVHCELDSEDIRSEEILNIGGSKTGQRSGLYNGTIR